MLITALLLALTCANAAALAPLAVGGDDSDCALYLTGPGRSSAYDYSINLLKGNFGYDGQQHCITYEAVNQAYLEARQRILVSEPKGDWKPEDYASVGELVLDISINLARRYGLTYEEIEKGLPLIDTSRTLIREVCPPVFSHVECRAGKYRRLDGLCNNLQNPTWGAINAPFQRLLSPLFSDGINSPRIAHTGHDLPLSRVVSRTMHPDDGFHDHAGTVMVIAWGQFMDHDYTLTGTPLDPINRNDPEECCKRPPHLKHPYCNEIRIPDDDYFYRLFGVKCIDFVRGFPSPRPGCRLGSRIPFNTLTATIDGNTVYGVTEKFARKLRTGFGGLLRMNPVFKEYGLKDLLPLKLDIPDEGCTRPNKNMYCFEAGEIRVNEQLVLTVMHTLMAREHNRVAKGLAEVNPHWDDETLYQEARRINIAEIQHITYNEFLPILLGKDVMEKFGLVLEKEGYWDGYDHEVNPNVLASFAAAAYRFGHSLLPTAVERWSKAHKFIASKRLSDLIRRPYDLYRAGVLDEYVMGLMNQVAQAMDDSITQEVTNHLFKKVGARFGMDLVSFNMQRGREFGLPGYMEFRKFCGLPGADSFQDLFGSMTNETVRKYESIFEHPVDVDLWSGGVSERPLPGSMLGPTFACIIATQFSYSRRGDRFWFELPNQPSSFTPEQLHEIRKSRLARVICDNTDIIDTVQLYPMVLPDHELNPRVPCRSGILPSMDFSKWAEPVPFHGNAKDFVTSAYVRSNSTLTTNNNDTVQVNKTDEEFKNNSQSEGNCVPHSLSTKLNCKCNLTNLVKDAFIHSNISTQNVSNEKDCTYETVVTQNTKNESSNNESTANKVDDTDTVLKYVYKNNENSNNPKKSTGHPLNSLKRKRRSVDSADLTGNENQIAPFIVNYETSHAPVNDREVWLPARNTANVIKSSDLADFNIETLHENAENKVNLKSDVNEHSTTSLLTQNQNKRSDDHSKEEDNNNYGNSDEDSEEGSKTHSHDSESNDDSRDSGEYLQRNNDKYTNSEERNDSNEGDSNKSGEKDDSREPDNLKSTKPRKEVIESNEDSRESNKKDYLRHDTSDVESSEEDSSPQNKIQETYQHRPSYKSNHSLPAEIQEVDLDDFSYERIHVNKDGKIESAKETLDNIDVDPAVEIITTSKPYTDTKNNAELNSISKENSDSSSIETDENNEPTHINDGEVKPVVEINTEASSNESGDENSNESLQASIEYEKLENLKGVKEGDSNEQNNKLQENTASQDKGDVKQQFERIPLNYNHNYAKHTEEEGNNNNVAKEESTLKTEDDGTLDKLTPKDVRYDENLNMKFDDIAIKLPEIKLPDDILSYSYEDPPVFKNHNENQQEKPKFYHYSNEQDIEEPRAKLNYDYEDNSNHNNNHYGYYDDRNTNQKYKKKQRDEEYDDKDDGDEDLYERFVRERFGKRGSFEKRSQKLQNYKANNPQLHKTVQNILKKTKNVREEADKSGDPNAGYMWTLEYGEKL